MPRPTPCVEQAEARHQTWALDLTTGHDTSRSRKKGDTTSPAAGKTDSGSNHSPNWVSCLGRGGPRHDEFTF
ncbi:hypothetical protein NDU88_005765 [Pleurodeles waltl]|uniref:Uncharacterized protein n=1 Tax=Pleurodeles waltl TaxID=8319 RepID=A0AAV7UJN0_PLEWA|nr:hypothetical protein NDU88_005765 [Pleurodeles waltl]